MRACVRACTRQGLPRKAASKGRCGGPWEVSDAMQLWDRMRGRQTCRTALRTQPGSPGPPPGALRQTASSRCLHSLPRPCQGVAKAERQEGHRGPSVLDVATPPPLPSSPPGTVLLISGPLGGHRLDTAHSQGRRPAAPSAPALPNHPRQLPWPELRGQEWSTRSALLQPAQRSAQGVCAQEEAWGAGLVCSQSTWSLRNPQRESAGEHGTTDCQPKGQRQGSLTIPRCRQEGYIQH